STTVRWFERLIEDAKRRLSPSKRLSANTILEWSVRLGDVVFPRLVHVGEVVARGINRLQITMLESMLLASLWFGVICIMVLLVLIFTG
ncbi:MAG: hypothetical protein QXJ18_04310, partial [Desulfurococcaceae archaeon]